MIVICIDTLYNTLFISYEYHLYINALAECYIGNVLTKTKHYTCDIHPYDLICMVNIYIKLIFINKQK